MDEENRKILVSSEEEVKETATLAHEFIEVIGNL